MKKGRLSPYFILLVSIFVWGCWAYTVQLAARGEVTSIKSVVPDLQALGQFGDAFGGLASLMAALAAASALSAFLRQREEIAVQEFERNFFTLLNNLQLIVADIDVKQSNSQELQEVYQSLEKGDISTIQYQVYHAFCPSDVEIKGREAMRALLALLREEIGDPLNFKDSKTIARVYEKFYDQWHDDLAHYFRTCYQIYRMINEDCPTDRHKYARMVRSHLSNSELILIAYNCAVGLGRFKFKSLVEEYSAFHNYHLKQGAIFFEKEEAFFRRTFSESAFRTDEVARFTY